MTSMPGIVAAALIGIGIYGALSQQSLVMIMMGLELIVNGALLAGGFLLLPFVAIRTTWRALPAKLRSGVYFSAIGLGFMFFEIALIQRFVLSP